MQFWNDIINTALLGTEKKQIATARLPSGLQEAAALIEGSAEEQFLQLAAVAFNFRQSGMKPLHKEEVTLPKAPAESLPYCSGEAMRVLSDIISEDNIFLLTFWLQRCAGTRHLVMPDWIPVLLNRAVNHPLLQDVVNTVCGERGKWLSGMNPSWLRTASSSDEELWQTGTAEQRKIVVRRLRQQDPARGREWLIQVWGQENANSKVELLKQMDNTVREDDEPWLAELLNEKSQKVKDEALRLLQQLPGSAPVKKYWTILESLIFLKKEKALLGMINKTSLQIHPPAIPEKGDFAPGIEKLSNDKVFTDGEFVLFQLIQVVPPSCWEEHFGLPPSSVLDLFVNSNEKYLPAFVKATVRFKDKKWASAYLEFRDVFYAELLDLLSPEQQVSYCVRSFKQYPDLVIQHARQWEREWGVDLAKAIICYTAKFPYQYNISFYKTNIHRIPVGVASVLEGAGPSEVMQRGYWINIAEQAGKLLGLKEKIINAFKE
jgi:hypothetical protein